MKSRLVIGVPSDQFQAFRPMVILLVAVAPHHVRRTGSPRRVDLDLPPSPWYTKVATALVEVDVPAVLVRGWGWKTKLGAAPTGDVAVRCAAPRRADVVFLLPPPMARPPRLSSC